MKKLHKCKFQDPKCLSKPRVFGCICGKGSSSSSSSNATTQTINEDNRVVGESGSVTLGKDAGLQINNDFGDNVAASFNELIDLSRSAGEVAVEATQRALDIAEKLSVESTAKSIETADKAIETVGRRVDRAEKGDKTIITDIFPLVALSFVGFGAIILLNKKRP